MRTKHILTAMVLPALFAACTADEFTENGVNVNLADRATLSPIAITVENGGVDTRFAWDDEASGGIGNWIWENTDAFSAFLVNDGTGKPEAWAPTNYLLTNYIYTSQDGANYTTTSAMVEGLYWFYAPARTSQGVGSNKLMSFELATSQDKDYWKSDAAKVFVTPLYRLVAGNEPNNLTLNLMNYYSRAVFPLTNNTNSAVEIRQIVLESNTTSPFAVKGNLSVEALSNYMYAFDESGEMVSVRNLDDDADNDETNEKLRERLATADFVNNDEAKVTTNVLVLNLGDGETLAKGDTKTFTMLVPRTENNTSCTIRIITNKGVINIEPTDMSNYAKNVQFKHNGVMPMFGLTSTSAFKSYSIMESKFENLGNAYYVGSYDDMIALINTVNGDFSVYNLGDWAIDANMADALTKSDSYVTFLQPITIKDESETVNLTKASFGRKAAISGGVTAIKNTVTVAEGTTVNFAKTPVSGKDNLVNGNLVIEKGATVVLTEGDFTGAAINNAGTLTIEKNANFDDWNQNNTNVVTSVGTLKIVNNTNVGVDMNGGDLEFAAPANGTVTYSMSENQVVLPAATDLEENGNATLSIGEGVTLNVNGSVRTAESYTDPTTKVTYSVAVVNNGTVSISNSCTLTTKGNLANNGEISGAGTLIIEGTATNAADAAMAAADITIDEDAVVTNNGVIKGTTTTKNEGTIITSAASETTVTAGDGTINNTAMGWVDASGAADQKVSYEITEAMASSGLTSLLGNLNTYYEVNKLVVKSALTIDAAGTEIAADYKDIDFENGSSITVRPGCGLTVEAVNVNVHGAVSFTGFDSDNSTYTFDGDGTTGATITVAKNGTLSIKRCKVSGDGTNNLTFASEDVAAGDPTGTVRGQVNVSNVAFTNANNADVEGMDWWNAD